MTRYAIYFAPPVSHPLWSAGCRWLGRDPRAGQATGDAPPQAREPWRYGWHATLKAPMRLRAPLDETNLLAAVQALARRHTRFMMPALAVAELSGFLALCPVEAPPAAHPLRRLADDCVQSLDTLRDPPNTAEQARRTRLPLDTQQQALLARWGYPHVLEQWRFHMTLSDALPAAERLALAARARDHFAAALAQPLACDALCVFTEAAPGVPFELTARCALAH